MRAAYLIFPGHTLSAKEVIPVYYPKRILILTAIAAILLGAGLHFLYDLLPNAVTALLSPVRESLWEHVKIVFWPYLAAALWLNRGRPGGMRPWLFTLPIMCFTMLALGFAYHILLGGEALWVDILIYTLVMALGFWLPTRFSGLFKGPLWALPLPAVVLLGLLIGLFTLYPPETILFSNLHAANWFLLSC